MNGPQTNDEDLELFHANLLDRLPNDENGLLVRPLRLSDYEKGFIQLLEQLTDVGGVTKEQFSNRFLSMKTSGGHYVVVVEDLNKGIIVGSATLVVEQKFIHNCALKGRVEDVVVYLPYRKQKLGKLLVETVTQLARRLRCYKLSLDCRDHLIKYYEKLGFKQEPGNANSLSVRFEPASEHSRL
ncbi:probable glucosamine 6-phosphate N-acetyltransferase [Chelonus insularis]|uniref:probable glucosamine 6-phosphate N-acetyltransferase n=1 Tax=Chelonus insularis TaxID=460826 RepID=UPI00158BD644|nr:probable glucosamine 6-phosphate N-acetyltransferase [Chelonus insularis]